MNRPWKQGLPFHAQIEIGSNGCWNWIGETTDRGYGRYYFKTRYYRAHRFSFESYYGVAVPPSRELDHLCRNRRCVNPLHLDAVTHQENMRRAHRTVCRKGHSDYVIHGNRRVCRTCHNTLARKYYHRDKEAA